MNQSPYQMPNSNHLMISTKTLPLNHMGQNPEMKAVVSGSAADILKAMLKERQGRQEGELFDCINSSLRIRKNR